MKLRLDKALVEKGLCKSRERARALIMEGKVLVNGHPVTKPGSFVKEEDSIELKAEDIPYVSRGGLKLEGALKQFNISVAGKTCMDIGASTGGFTDCLLKHGAKRVYAVDVGYGQLDWSLRNDPRVVVIERTNIRHMERDRVPEEVDIITIDVSFISLTKVIPKALEFLKADGEIIALVKPQFELTPQEVEKGGVIKTESKRLKAINKIKDYAESIGLLVLGITESPIKGSRGNVEYFIYLKNPN
ncbi:MAG: TlyA family RNA methyltransferase [Nitrospirae bacterium]|nr:TlyA family RNA methyltransferase [Nitrospirota bacterium]